MPVFETERGSRLRVVLPQTDWKELTRAAEAYGTLLQERKVTESRLYTLRNEREKAERKDARELATWLKEGKKGKEPEPNAVEKIDKETRACERRLVGIDEALDDAESDLINVVDEHREEWKEAAEVELTSAYDEYAAAVEQLAEVHDRLSASLGLRSWLQFFPEDPFYIPRGMLLPTLRAAHGDPYLFDEIVTALREDAQVRRREQPISVSETQRIHEDRLANEREGRGYYTDDELARLEENPDVFRHGAGVRIVETMPMQLRRGTGPAVVDGAVFVTPGDGDE
jgi:hypothetical protein